MTMNEHFAQLTLIACFKNNISKLFPSVVILLVYLLLKLSKMMINYLILIQAVKFRKENMGNLSLIITQLNNDSFTKTVIKLKVFNKLTHKIKTLLNIQFSILFVKQDPFK
jgi:hypothetical protein